MELRRVFFFFQAEDGIRDIGVTGVQTCALPIYLSLPGRRTAGFSSRRSFRMSWYSEEPLGQSVPRLMGSSGSPSTWTTCGVTFLALSPSVWMMTPQLTEQYGQMDLVSVVRAILSSRAWARTGAASNPSSSAAVPPGTTLKKSRLDKPI